MSIDGNLDYALARVYARHGQRLDEQGWRRLEANRDLALYLGAVRSTDSADWVSTFEADDDSHTIERALRGGWRGYVDTVAAWHPEAWQAWLAWLAWLPGLSLLAQLSRPDPAPAWLLADPVYGPLAPGTLEERTAALAGSALAPLEPALANRSSPAAAWSAHWQSLRPRCEARTEHCLQMLLRAMERHEHELLHAADTAEPLRGELAHELQRLLRIAADTVIATVCHLALVALDMERLRGGLARRRLFALAQTDRG